MLCAAGRVLGLLTLLRGWRVSPNSRDKKSTSDLGNSRIENGPYCAGNKASSFQGTAARPLSVLEGWFFLGSQPSVTPRPSPEWTPHSKVCCAFLSHK